MEYLDILDEEGKLTGHSGLKDEVKQGGHWHRVVNLWILSPEGDILQMKRSGNLTYFPLYWSTLGGHVQAGERAEDALLRETEEELGLQLSVSAISHAFTDKAVYPWKDKTLRVFRDVFTTLWRGDLEELTPDPREVEELRWFSREILKERYDQNHGEVFPLPAPYLKELWKYI